MDILLSLPVASYFWSTSLTSWSTSLNLLFFYMTWSTLVLSHSPVKIEIVGTTAIRLALWLLPSMIFLLFDTLLPSLSETVKYDLANRRRRQSRTAILPSRDAKAISKLVALAVFNLALETAVEGGLSLTLGTLLKTPIFRTTTTLPLPWQMIKHVGLLFTMREVLGYCIHRFLLHNSRARIPSVVSAVTSKPTTRSGSGITGKLLPKLGNTAKKHNNTTNTRLGGRLASLHSRYSHSSPSYPPCSLQRGTDHPLPFLLHRFVPSYLPAAALSLSIKGNLHLLTYFLFVGLSTLEETLAMSGYTFVPGIVMGGIAKRTAMHYQSGGKGNYGSWGVMDWLGGTGLGGSGRGLVDDVRESVDERGGGREVAEGVWEGVKRAGRGRKAASAGGKKGRAGSTRRRKGDWDEDGDWRGD